MPKHGKKYLEAVKQVEVDHLYQPAESIELLKKAAQVAKGAANPLKGKVGSITRAQLREIAETKMRDLNATNIEGAERIVEGAARSMGITVQ